MMSSLSQSSIYILGLLLLVRFNLFLNAAEDIAMDLGNDMYLSNDGYTFSTSTASVGWQGQFAIGNGKTGALVGGVFEVDIMPITTADLFVIGRDAFKQMRHIFTNNASVPQNYGEGSITREKFNTARNKLTKKNAPNKTHGVQKSHIQNDTVYYNYFCCSVHPSKVIA